MTELLTENLSLIAAAPNGVQKLRELILQLAVMGKLVRQDPKDKPASTLLKHNVGSGSANSKRTSSRKIPRVTNQHASFNSLPRGWAPIAINEIAHIQGGSTPSMSNGAYWGGQIPWVSPKDMHSGDIRDTELKITEKALAEWRIDLVPSGSILIVGRSGILKRKLPVQVTAVPCTINQDLKAITLAVRIEPSFFKLLLMGNERKILAQDVKQGTTVQSLVYERLFSRPFGLPPHAEQHRIVAKVAELMALCDRLESQQADAEATHTVLVKTLLDALVEAPNHDDFATMLGLVKRNFDVLFTTDASIDAMKQTILQLAVMGKLVRQDPKDKPAARLLTIIRTEKSRLIKEGRLKADKLPWEVTPDAQPFPLPSTWRWAPLGAIASVIDPNPSHRMPKYVERGVPFVSTENFAAGDSIDFSLGKQVQQETLEDQIGRFEIREGAFALSRIGTIGKTRPLPTKRNYGLSHALCVVSPYLPVLCSKFLRLAVTAESVFRLAHHGVQSIGVPDLGVGTLRALPIPIPPTNEQHRIVAKVDELMTFCDRLKAGLVEARSQQGRVAASLIEQALTSISSA